MEVLLQVSIAELVFTNADGAAMFCVTVVEAEAVQPLAGFVPTTVNVPGALKVAAAVVCPFDQT